jgi:hypothetical protein
MSSCGAIFHEARLKPLVRTRLPQGRYNQAMATPRQPGGAQRVGMAVAAGAGTVEPGALLNEGLSTPSAARAQPQVNWLNLNWVRSA